MIEKDSIFASAGTTAGSSEAGYTTGMRPNTIAKAEDVNLYMGLSDQQLYAVCNEVANLLKNSGISLDPNNNSQLSEWAVSKLTRAAFLTGVDAKSYTSAPIQNGNSISFPVMKIVYNKDVYYGKTSDSQQETTLAAQTLSATSGWGEGVHFIYAQTTLGSSVSTLGHSQNPVSGSESATKCYLGSVFVINGAFQASSWKFQPWLQVTSVERRESPTAMTRGGAIAAASSTTLKMGLLEIMDEGINFGVDITAPNIVTISSKSPYDYKFLYPGYNPSAAAVTTLDTTHMYNMANGSWIDVSGLAGKYIIMVPCVAPTGQTLMIPAMTNYNGVSYTQVYATMEDAVNNIYGQQYVLGNVAKRVIYLGQSIVVRIGATDLQDPLQCLVVGQVPQALGGFSAGAGQTGGAISTYRPMPLKNWGNTVSFTALNNTANWTTPGNNSVTITLPTPQSDIVNQLEIYFSKTGTGNINWNTTIYWYTGSAPTFSTNRSYNIILEYIAGAWYGGVLGVGA